VKALNTFPDFAGPAFSLVRIRVLKTRSEPKEQMETQKTLDWFLLKDYVEDLLKDGKRSQHEDFQMLFRIFGEERITKMAKEILESWKAAKDA
jgi:hypothetical protein